uniref:Uncharacterized protein n=1 Tax=viral metagenome TaxID=1070528 RepID=A0A6C0IRZ2_9ZZZZ
MEQEIDASILDLDLDTNWIDEFNKLDNEYKSYYKEELSFVKIHSIYVNSENEIEKLIEEKLLLKVAGFVSKNDVLGIIKKNMVSNNTKYKLLSILKFNIDLDPYYLKQFLRYTKTTDSSKKGDLVNIGNQFLYSNKNIDDIIFEKSISMFHDINDLIFIYYFDSKKEDGKNDNSSNNKFCRTNNSSTKKVFIYSTTNKKTKRKYT